MVAQLKGAIELPSNVCVIESNVVVVVQVDIAMNMLTVGLT